MEESFVKNCLKIFVCHVKSDISKKLCDFHKIFKGNLIRVVIVVVRKNCLILENNFKIKIKFFKENLDLIF